MKFYYTINMRPLIAVIKDTVSLDKVRNRWKSIAFFIMQYIILFTLNRDTDSNCMLHNFIFV